MFLITKFTNVVSHLLTLFFNCVFSAKLLFFVLLPLLVWMTFTAR